jgi:RNA polymerase sigma-70 factor (ECF subfamily)
VKKPTDPESEPIPKEDAVASNAPVVDAGERRLVGQAREGNVGAFEALYRAHVGRVHAVCRRLVGDPIRAEELTQDVFVRAWERLESFQGRSAFGSWLYRLAVNLVIDAKRAEIRRSARETAAEDPAAWERPRPPREPGVGWDLERAIAALPPGARAVFVLHEIEGYRHEEIAEMAGLAEGTCKAQLHRARRLLREMLEP